MTTDTEALRAQFEAWATAAYRLSFDDDTPLKRYLWTAYQAGHAAAKAETADASDGRWYMLANDGMATLCASEADALAEAADADAAWPRKAPHRAVQLVPAHQLAEAQRDSERLDWIIEHRAYVVSDPDCCDGYWLNYARPDGTLWTQATEHETPRAAIDAAKEPTP